jgi:formylglycine-generating enzyme required for sulfatase activity
MKATVTESGVQLEWQQVAVAELEGYRLYRSVMDSVNLVPVADLDSEASQYFDSEPPRASVVWYRIAARFPGGESAAQPSEALRVYTAPVVLIEHDSTYSNNANVSLSIQGLRACWMWLSNYSDFSDGQWHPYDSVITAWGLPGEDGYKSVYLKINYDDSTLSPPVYDDIILDRTATILWLDVAIPESPLGLCDWIGATMATEDTVGIAWILLRSQGGAPLYPPSYLEKSAPGLFEGGMEIRWGQDVSDVQVEGCFQDLAGNQAEPETSPQSFEIELGMVEVPAGPFTMGIDGLDPREGPAHEVYLDQYWINRYLVTNYQYAQFLSGGNSQYFAGLPWQLIEDLGGGDFRAVPGFEHFPVVYVLWEEAEAYAEWQGLRLPTEAEWEKAARGTDARIYPWGNSLPNPSQANYLHSGDPWEQLLMPPISPCGFYNGRNYEGFPTVDTPGPYGSYDMAGNVWEWVADWYDPDYYSVSPYMNPQGPDSGSVKVIRGGDCYSGSYYLRSHVRYYPFDMQNRSSNVGFRCASSYP